MHSFTTMKQWRLTQMLLFIILFKTGESETGIAGTGTGYLPEPDGGSDKPEEIIARALQCFNDKQIYKSCEESCRLTESGQLHVAAESTDEYCNGPCLKETHLVLDCIDEIFSHYVFSNRATIKDVKETIKAACSYGPDRGDFNVTEHIEGDGSNAHKLSYFNSILFGLSTLILVFNLLS